MIILISPIEIYVVAVLTSGFAMPEMLLLRPKIVKLGMIFFATFFMGARTCDYIKLPILFLNSAKKNSQMSDLNIRLIFL
jgi:hypothetical protein